MAGDFIMDDLPQFFNSNELADLVTYTPVGGTESDQFPANFDEGYIDIDPETGDDNSVNPTISCQSEYVPSLSHKGVFKIDSVSYTVHTFYIMKGVAYIELHK